MKKLYLLRHAKAEKESVSQKDFDRKLNQKGVIQANVVGHLIKEREIQIDRIFCSKAQRTSQTLDIILPHIKIEKEKINIQKDLYLAEANYLKNMLQNNLSTENSAMIVGHNFGISELASLFTGENISLSTCNMAIIEFETNTWEAVDQNTGMLKNIISPKVKN